MSSRVGPAFEPDGAFEDGGVPEDNARACGTAGTWPMPRGQPVVASAGATAQIDVRTAVEDIAEPAPDVSQRPEGEASMGGELGWLPKAKHGASALARKTKHVGSELASEVAEKGKHGAEVAAKASAAAAKKTGKTMKRVGSFIADSTVRNSGTVGELLLTSGKEAAHELARATRAAVDEGKDGHIAPAELFLIPGRFCRQEDKATVKLRLENGKANALPGRYYASLGREMVIIHGEKVRPPLGWCCQGGTFCWHKYETWEVYPRELLIDMSLESDTSTCCSWLRFLCCCIPGCGYGRNGLCYRRHVVAKFTFLSKTGNVDVQANSTVPFPVDAPSLEAISFQVMPAAIGVAQDAMRCYLHDETAPRLQRVGSRSARLIAIGIEAKHNLVTNANINHNVAPDHVNNYSDRNMHFVKDAEKHLNTMSAKSELSQQAAGKKAAAKQVQIANEVIQRH